MMSTAHVSFKSLITNIFLLCQEHFFTVSLHILPSDDSPFYGLLISYYNLTTGQSLRHIFLEIAVRKLFEVAMTTIKLPNY